LQLIREPLRRSSLKEGAVDRVITVKNEPRGRKITGGSQTSQAHLSDKNKWWYACRLLRTNSLKEVAMWHADPLLVNDHEISNYKTGVTR
jgi:hypothetical protein